MTEEQQIDGAHAQLKALVPAELSPSKPKRDVVRPPLDLLPSRALRVVAAVIGAAAPSKGTHTWRAGRSHHRTLGSALRHIYKHLDGEDLDPEFNLPHLAHAAAQLLFTLQAIADSRDDLDDRYKKEKP